MQTKPHNLIIMVKWVCLNLGLIFVVFSPVNASEIERTITLEVSGVPNAYRYDLEVKNKGAADDWAILHENQDQLIKISLELGIYEIRSRAVGESGAKGPWSDWQVLDVKRKPPRQNKDVPGIREFKIMADARTPSKLFQFEISKSLRGGGKTDNVVVESENPLVEVSRAPGVWEFRVRRLEIDGSLSEWGPAQKFLVPFPSIAVKSPVGNEKIDPTDDEFAEVLIAWKPSAAAELYQLKIWNEAGQKVKEAIVQGEEYMAMLPHLKRYTWTVNAIDESEVGRSPASEESIDPEWPDDSKGEFSISKYKRLELS